MIFDCSVFDEPELEFGEQHTSVDPRLGLIEAGPLQVDPGDTIKIGVVGDAASVEATEAFMDRVAIGIESTNPKHRNMHPDFPGLGNQNPFRSRFEIVEDAKRTLSNRILDEIVREPDDTKAVERACDAIIAALQELQDSGERPDVAVVALPVKLIERVWNAQVLDDETGKKARSDSKAELPNFRGMLKARAMEFGFPTQIIWQDVVDPSIKIPKKVKESSQRSMQEESDRAWNLLTTLYYKGSRRIPWRRFPKEGELRSCFVGISFYLDRFGENLWSSCAQMFDERGRGFILKGAKAQTESRNRHPYLTEADAKKLVDEVLEAYRNHHKHYPARVVVMKTSRFREEEAAGIVRSLNAVETEYRDLVWVQESYSARIFRDGDYPVLRGTFLDLGKSGLLYTNGSIPYYSTYPGQYSPNPLLISPHEGSDRTVREICEEIFSLTKVNWNSTQMNQKLPIPIRASRKVGEVLKYVSEGQQVSSDYSKYI